MKKHPREAAQGLQIQGPDESISYAIDVSNLGNDPTNVTVTVNSSADGYVTDVTADHMETGPIQIVGNVITLPRLHSLELGITYRVNVHFTLDGNELTRFIRVHAE